MFYSRAQALVRASLIWLMLTGAALAQSTDANPVCGQGIVSEDGRFDLARIGPLIAGNWSEQAYGVRVAAGVQSTSVSIIHDAMRGRIYIQGDGVQLPLTIRHGTGKRYKMGWDYSHEFLPIHPDQRLLDPRTGADDEILAQENCEWINAPQFTWQFASPRGNSEGFYSFLSPNVAVGSKWNSAMGAREVILRRR